MADRRGVSNTLGYVLLFGVVFFSIVAVHAFGVGALAEGRQDTIAQNAALSMESMGDAIDDLRKENTTARLSIIRGGSGTLSPGDPTTITVDAGGTSKSFTVEPIVYQLDETRIVYEAGALIRVQEGGGAVLVDRPGFELDDSVIILPVTRTSSAADSSVNGETVTTYLEKTTSKVTHRQTGYTGTVSVKIETSPQRAVVWERTLDEMAVGNDPCSVSGDEVECDFNDAPTNSLSVIVRDIAVSYEFVT